MYVNGRCHKPIITYYPPPQSDSQFSSNLTNKDKDGRMRENELKLISKIFPTTSSSSSFQQQSSIIQNLLKINKLYACAISLLFLKSEKEKNETSLQVEEVSFSKQLKKKLAIKKESSSKKHKKQKLNLNQYPTDHHHISKKTENDTKFPHSPPHQHQFSIQELMMVKFF